MALFLRIWPYCLRNVQQTAGASIPVIHHEEAARPGRGPPGLLAGALACGGLLVLLLAFYARGKTLGVTTFDGDEYAFALVARDILHGKLPYTGIFDNKPVGLNYVFALAQAIGGQTVVAIHALGMIVTGLAAALIYLSTRRLRMPVAVALGLAALFATQTLYLGSWATMSELVALPLLCLANHLMLACPPERKSLGVPQLLALGAAYGLCVQITYLALPAFGLVALGLTLEPPLRWQSLMARGLAIGIGFVAALALAWLPQLLSGDLPHYLAEQGQYHAAYRRPLPPLWLWRSNFIEPLLWLGTPTAAACVLHGIGYRRFPLDRAVYLLGLQLIGALIAACASNRLYLHYLILALPAAALLPAAVLQGLPPAYSRWLALAVLACTAFHQIGLLRAMPGDLARPSLEADAARLIDSRTSPNSAIMVFNAQHSIYYLSNRAAATRFVFPNHYLSTCDGAPAIKPAQEVLQQGLAAKPALLLVGHLCRATINADALARQAHYQPVDIISVNGQSLTIYAPTR